MSSEIVYIKWKDACYRGDYADRSDVGQTVEIEEVGFILMENDEAITISCEQQVDEPHVRLSLTIPRINIVEEKRVALKDAFQLGKKARKPRVTKKSAALIEGGGITIPGTDDGITYGPR